VTIQNIVVIGVHTQTTPTMSATIYIQDPTRWVLHFDLSQQHGRRDDPAVGDIITVTAHLGHFDGLLQMSTRALGSCSAYENLGRGMAMVARTRPRHADQRDCADGLFARGRGQSS